MKLVMMIYLRPSASTIYQDVCRKYHETQSIRKQALNVCLSIYWRILKMQRFPRRWDKITCINFLQRKIILNAIAYYELDSPRLSDREYDELSYQLVELQKDIDIQETQYGYVMYDFDGTTGFDLYGRLNEKDKRYLMQLARYIFGSKSESKRKKKGGLF